MSSLVTLYVIAGGRVTVCLDRFCADINVLGTFTVSGSNTLNDGAMSWVVQVVLMLIALIAGCISQSTDTICSGTVAGLGHSMTTLYKKKIIAAIPILRGA